jgi:hypothetical protein
LHATCWIDTDPEKVGRRLSSRPGRRSRAGDHSHAQHLVGEANLLRSWSKQKAAFAAAPSASSVVAMETCLTGLEADPIRATVVLAGPGSAAAAVVVLGGRRRRVLILLMNLASHRCNAVSTSSDIVPRAASHLSSAMIAPSMVERGLHKETNIIDD